MDFDHFMLVSSPELILSNRMITSFFDTFLGLLSKCFLSVKISSAASSRSCDKEIDLKLSFCTRFKNL